MTLKWPGGKAKIQSLKLGIPAVVCGQVMEVIDQIDTIVISVHDKDGEANVFYSKMEPADMAFHAMHIHDYLNQLLAGRIDEDD